MPQDPQYLSQYWLMKTNQAWKFLVFLSLMFLAGGVFIAMIMIVNKFWAPDFVGEFELGLASVVLGFGSLIWFCLSVKCPHCGYKPVWPILHSAPAGEWLSRITHLEQCPSCKR